MRSLLRLLELSVGVALTVWLVGMPPQPAGRKPRPYGDNLPLPNLSVWNHPGGPVTEFPADDLSGVGAYLSTYIPWEEVPRATARLQELGLHWARNEITWAMIERERGIYDFTETDRVVKLLRDSGYEILGMLCYRNRHYPDDGAEMREGFARYAEATARRYRGRVDHWEIWNEPNLRDYWQGSMEEYAELLRLAAAAVRRGNPEARISIGGTSGIDVPYITALLTLGAADWVDAIAVHPYTFGWNPESTELYQQLRALEAMLDEQEASMPIWITEIGFESQSVPGGEQRQWELLNRMLILAAQSRVVELVTIHSLWHQSEEKWVLYRQDWSPRPAVAIAETARRLRGKTALGSDLSPTQTRPWAAGAPWAHAPLQSWLFESTEGRQRAVWSTVGSVGLPDGQGGWDRVGSMPIWSAR